MRRRRLIVFAFHLRRLGGHHLREAMGFVRFGTAAGFDVTTYAPVDCDPAVAEAASAERLIPAAAYPPRAGEDLLEVMPAGAKSLDPVWSHILAGGLERDDLIVFTHATPIALFDLSRRLATLAAASRPAVFIKFMGVEFREPNSGKFHPHAQVHRFVARLLAENPEPERVFYTIANQRLAGVLTRLCGRRTFLVPMPLDYLQALYEGRAAHSAFTIYFHVTEAGEMERRALAVAGRILRAWPEVRVVLKLCRYRADPTLPPPDLAADRDRVSVIMEAQSAEDYSASLGSADMVVLPYPRRRYQNITSGVFCEAAAAGAIVVIPDDTWMADEMARGRGVGVTFGDITPEAIFAAVESGYRRREELSAEARRRAPVFRAAQNQGMLVARMLELAAAPPDMRADSAVGDDIDFTIPLGSRHLLASGWSATEEGLGVWSNDDRAGLSFNLADAQAAPLVLEVTGRPFLAPRHETLAVRVSAGGTPIADWHFGGPLNAEVTRRATISAALATARPLKIDLAFDRPASPAELGMSADPRRLGLLLRSLRFLSETAAQPAM